jgi:hypothetical protein
VAITGEFFKAVAREPLPKKWGWDIYYWVARDCIVVGNHRGLVNLCPNPRFFSRYVTQSRMPKTLVKVGEL